MIRIIDVWAVHQGDDDRQSGYPEFFFSTKEAANQKAKGIGWCGGPATVVKRQALTLDGRYFLLDDIGEIDLDGAKIVHNEKIRKQALKKLSAEERNVLGLSEE